MHAKLDRREADYLFEVESGGSISVCPRAPLTTYRFRKQKQRKRAEIYGPERGTGGRLGFEFTHHFLRTKAPPPLRTRAPPPPPRMQDSPPPEKKGGRGQSGGPDTVGRQGTVSCFEEQLSWTHMSQHKRAWLMTNLTTFNTPCGPGLFTCSNVSHHSHSLEQRRTLANSPQKRRTGAIGPFIGW